MFSPHHLRESYEEAAVRELREETRISASVVFLGRFSHHDEPESQIVAVFVCKSDAVVTIDKAEATGVRFYSKEEIDRIVASEKVTPWLRDGWLLLRDRIRDVEPRVVKA